MSERRGMKTSTLAGLLVVAGIGIGALLSSILPELPFGIGSGWNGLGNPAGNAAGKSEEKSVAKQTTEKNSTESNPESAQSGPNSNSGGSQPPPEVVHVVVIGRSYFIRNDRDDVASQRQVTLPELVEAVKSATGDENDIRIKIWLKTTAKTTTVNTLMHELEKAQIPRGEIRKIDQPIEQ